MRESRTYGSVRGAGSDARPYRDELLGAVPTKAAADHFAGLDIEGGEQRQRAMALIVVGASFGLPGLHRQQWCVLSSAWIWLFSSTHSTTARSGGSR